MSSLRRRFRFAVLVALSAPVALFHVLALKLRPARSIARSAPRPRHLLAADDRQISAAVSVASRAVPSCTCLPQAQTVRSVMAVAGRRGAVRFGVERGTGIGFAAHAWVEDEEGRIVHGATARDWTPLEPARGGTTTPPGP